MCFFGHSTKKFCVYISSSLQCSCSVSEWQIGAWPGKSLCETQDVSRWLLCISVFPPLIT